MKFALFVLLFSPCLFAQAPPSPAAATSEPALGDLDKEALGAISKDLDADQKALQRDVQRLHTAEAAIAREYPGYRFDEKTGKLIKAEPVVAAAKPDPKK
jgi:hypothetical protein